MTKSELIDEVAQQLDLPRKRAEQVVKLIFDDMCRALARGERIEIRGFGSFRAKRYPPYSGRNPKTGRVIQVDEKVLPVFKVGKELRGRVNGAGEPIPQAAVRRRGN